MDARPRSPPLRRPLDPRAMSHVGRVSLLVVDAVGASPSGGSGCRATMTEAWNIGVGSLFIVLLISGFAGAVTALQARYQFTGTIPIYYLAGVIVESIVLELGPVLTGLVLAGPDRRALRRGAGHHARHRADRRAGEPRTLAGVAPHRPAGAGRVHHDPGAHHARRRDGHLRRLVLDDSGAPDHRRRLRLRRARRSGGRSTRPTR